MAARFGSHFRPPQDEASPQTQRKPSSRIPTKPTSSNTESKQSKTAQHVTRLAKRASRSITPLEKVEHGTRITERGPPPATATRGTPDAPKKSSVARASGWWTSRYSLHIDINIYISSQWSSATSNNDENTFTCFRIVRFDIRQSPKHRVAEETVDNRTICCIEACRERHS